MFKWILLSLRFYFLRPLLMGALLMAMPALAQAPAPSKEFWDYIEEYGDERGNVLDPLEYDQIINIKNDEKTELKKTPPATEPAPIDKPKVRNVDMKFEQKSSAVSSNAMKGAKL